MLVGAVSFLGGAAPALAAVDQVKKKSAGAAVQSSGRIRPAARLRLAREESRKEWLTRILPLLKWKCASCHQSGGEGYEKSGLDLTSYEGVMKGTKFGPMVVPGDPDLSNLMLLLDWRAAPAIRMPHGKKQLSICDRNTIRTWIKEGAKGN
jgi:hypothetical protein